MNQIYQRKNYKIYKVDDGYILHNSKNEEIFMHSHIKNYKTCLWIIDLSLKKKCPYNISKYLLISLIRINDDEKYLNRLNQLLDKKNNKKEIYFNSNKGIRKK